MASRIEDYGLIGNTRTSALVSRAGSIDWLCGPRFDSDAWFAALVGYDEHGRWALRPTVPVRQTTQRYRDDTMTLETEFVCDGGAVRVTDFMPVSEDRCDVVRIVDGLAGEVPLEMLLDVRFGYGHDTPWVWPVADGVCFTAGPDTVLLRAPIPIGMAGSRVSAYPRVKMGDRVSLQLTWHPSHESAPVPLNAEQELNSTDAFWRGWARRCTYQGRWRESVMRSLLT